MSSRTDNLTPRDLKRLCGLIYERSGINISPEKKIMLEGRLRRRLSALKVASYSEYCKYLFDSRDDEELGHLIDAVSTNKTDFFREKEHFERLVDKVLPEFAAANKSGRELLFWSAGCSTGEEPYTLAMVLDDYGRQHAGFRFRVLATDISTVVLEKAKRGVFHTDAAAPVPLEFRRRYFMRSRDRESKLLRVVPELRQTIEFQWLNLMEEFRLPQLVDVIFCRNVIIYFDRPTQERLFRKMAGRLTAGGYVFVGHSESLHHMDVPLVPVAAAIYRKADGHGPTNG
jgi:chemotaxis protein methyltransferase CheR